jgi:hypothetical protein
MVFHQPAKFRLPKHEVAQMNLGAKRAVFEKPESSYEAVIYKGILGWWASINRLLVDGGACVNIMPYNLFEKLGHEEKELIRTNMTLNGFVGEASDTKGIVSKELTVGSKTVPTAFFIVDVKGKYNALLG